MTMVRQSLPVTSVPECSSRVTCVLCGVLVPCAGSVSARLPSSLSGAMCLVAPTIRGGNGVLPHRMKRDVSLPECTSA